MPCAFIQVKRRTAAILHNAFARVARFDHVFGRGVTRIGRAFQSLTVLQISTSVPRHAVSLQEVAEGDAAVVGDGGARVSRLDGVYLGAHQIGM
jgi:hypothetical protein